MKADDSIIEIIQKMVQEGQSREKIIQTLQDLGVTEEQSKKLLLIAEADTFTLLRKEISSMVKEEFASNQKNFESLIHSDLEKIEDEERQNIKSLANIELRDAKKMILDESKNFEDRINKTISSSQKTVSMVKIALDSLNERIAQMELDLEQLKVHKFRKKTMVFSYAMLGLGAILLLVSIALFAFNFGKLDLAQIVMIAILVLASVVLMFASILG